MLTSLLSHSMLYRTQHPFSLQFPSATTIPLSPFRLLSPSPQVQTQMECVEAALKTSFRKEMALKSSPQLYLDDASWAVNVQNGVSCDDFFVDQLFDFSQENGFAGGEEEEDEEKGCACAVSVSTEKEAAADDDKSNDLKNNLCSKDDFGSVLLASEIAVPVEDFASLEWLSHFVEDSNSEYCAPFPAGIIRSGEEKKENPTEHMKVITDACFRTPIPAKARSKRTRTGVRVWPLGSPSLAESSSSSTSSSSSSSPPNPWLVYNNLVHIEPAEPVFSGKPSAQKQKKPSVEDGSGAQPPRRCSHCGVQKTPQWRTGPLGAKTLCNACGVRYKSGRLLPEYRPACSPTFSSELHSNHHRKVLEMRKKKESSVQFQSDEPVLAPSVVPSFGLSS